MVFQLSTEWTKAALSSIVASWEEQELLSALEQQGCTKWEQGCPFWFRYRFEDSWETRKQQEYLAETDWLMNSNFWLSYRIWICFCLFCSSEYIPCFLSYHSEWDRFMRHWVRQLMWILLFLIGVQTLQEFVSFFVMGLILWLVHWLKSERRYEGVRQRNLIFFWAK